MSTRAMVPWIAGALAVTLAMTGSPAAARGLGPSEGPEDGAAPSAEAEDPAGEAGEAAAAAGEGEPSGEDAEVDQAEADRAAAKAAFEAGSDLYELGKYSEAAEQFKRAWELSKAAPLLYNLGQAHWKWFDVDPQIDHLRQAALFFRNYDKRMRTVEGYDSVEIDSILKAIDAQIENEERKIAEANRPVIVQPGGPTEEELAWQQRRRTTRALNVSGITLAVVGGVTLAGGAAALGSRLGHGFMLDNATSSDGGINLATAEEDAQRRNGFLVSGQVAFGTLIAAAVILPVGITLRVLGAVRDKKDRAEARERDQQRERNLEKAKGTADRRRGRDQTGPRIAIEPSPSGLRVRF